MDGQTLIFEQLDEFYEWLSGLDECIQLIVLERIRRARRGHLGKLLKGTGGIYEITIDTGPGYRIYYCREANTIYWLLAGGVKDTQRRDVKRAMALHDELTRSGYA